MEVNEPSSFAKVGVAGSNPVVRSIKSGSDVRFATGDRPIPRSLPMSCPCLAHDAYSPRVMARGSMRQRGKDSWELRVYQGMDP